MNGPVLSILLAFIAYAVWAAQYNAVEAHKHLHEIGCHVGITEHCLWVTTHR